MEKYYTVNEVASAMQVTPKTVREWIKHGILKALKVGVNVRISESAIAELTDKNK